MFEEWDGKRYNSLNSYLKRKFGEKVFKISLDGGFSCPNRDGTISSRGCIFCSEKGSGDFAGNRSESIKVQFEKVKEIMQKKWKSKKYIAYFQAYTNTYAPLDILKNKYNEALENDGTVGLAVATRPDCIDEDVLKLLSEFNKKTYLWVELGLQTSNDNTASIINRGYTLDVFEDCLERLRKNNINVVVHTIFGLPGESHEDMINTIRYLSKKDIQGIKIHLLYLLKNTPMEELYNKGELKFLKMDEYVELVSKAISILPPSVVIHRLTGDAPRDLIIGPMWSLKKWEVLNAIDKCLRDKDIYQGLDVCTN